MATEEPESTIVGISSALAAYIMTIKNKLSFIQMNLNTSACLLERPGNKVYNQMVQNG